MTLTVSLLFIGLEVLLLAGVMAVPLLLLSRWISGGAPVLLLRTADKLGRGAVPIMTWGGLRGGISVALALSLPAEPQRELILAVTYVLVVFSILIQGPTLNRLIRRVSAG